MAANNFSLNGNVNFYSQEEFLIKTNESGFKSINYIPNFFGGEEKKPLVFKNKTFQKVSFKSTDIKYINFINCKFYDCLFIGSKLINCEFINCEFERTNTHKIKINNCLIDPIQFKNNFELKKDANIAVDLYHELYRNSKLEEQPKYANISLYQMKLALSYNLNYKLNIEEIGKVKFYCEKTKDFFHKNFTGYGLRIDRIFISFIIIVIVMSFLNFTLIDSFSDKMSGLVDSFYFTFVTVTTLGYGDITPETNTSKIIIIIESVVGFVYMSLFVGAFINRVLRS